MARNLRKTLLMVVGVWLTLLNCTRISSVVGYERISFILTLFFFQAEDGIRDYKVTGVQTCALPISTAHPSRRPSSVSRALAGQFGCGPAGSRTSPPTCYPAPD